MARPWIGSDWGKSDNAVGGLRIMILGESHYHDEAPVGTDIPDLTEWVVNSYLEDGRMYPFISKLEGLVMTGRQARTPRDVWNSLVFYNYVPVVAANRARQRPPEELWDGSAPQLFSDVVKRVEAEAILVCGTTLWRRMTKGLGERNDAYEAGGRKWREREYEVALPHRAVAAHIPHPSGWGWSYERCTPVIHHLRRRANELRQEFDFEPIP